jgi:hypothetical protein
MTRLEALLKAREIVDAMATNGRGYQDGVKFADKVAATERYALFLLGEDVTEDDE